MDRRNGKILIVDDEPELLRMMSAYLSRMGHSVEILGDTKEAWSRLQANPGEYSVAVIDATLEGMPMAELAAKALQADPDLRVIAASGYPVDTAMLEVAAPGRVAYLPKPFSPEMLAALVRRMIGPQEEAL